MQINSSRRRRWLGTMLAAVGALAVGIAAAASDTPRFGPARSLAPVIDPATNWDMIGAGPGGQIAYFTLTTKRQLRVNGIADGGRDALVYQLPDAPGGALISDVSLDADGDARYLLWWAKYGKLDTPGGAKQILFARSPGPGQPFSDARIVNSSGAAPLPPLAVSAGADGLVVAAWTDERRGGDRHHVHVNISRDGGRTFEANDRQISGHYDNAQGVALLVEGREIHVFFAGQVRAPSSKEDKESRKARKNRAPDGVRGRRDTGRSEAGAKVAASLPPGLYVVHSYSRDGGQTWQEQRLLRSDQGGSVSRLTPLRTAGTGSAPGRLWLFYSGKAEGMKGHYSDDNGQTWQEATLPQMGKDDVVLTFSVAAARDSVFIGYTTDKLVSPTSKADAFLLVGRDGGRRWESPQRLATDPAPLTMKRRVKVYADETGRVVVIWSDWRNIRPTTYLSWSSDLAATWAAREVPVQEPGRFNNRFPGLVNLGGGHFEVVYFQYGDDRLQDGGLWATRVDLPVGGAGRKTGE